MLNAHWLNGDSPLWVESESTTIPQEEPRELRSSSQAVAIFLDQILISRDRSPRLQRALVSGRARNFSEALSSLSQGDQRFLTEQIGARNLYRLTSLAREPDPQFFLEGFMALAHRLRRQGNTPFAGLALQVVERFSDNLSGGPIEEIRDRAGQHLAALRGEGSWGLQFQYAFQHLFHELGSKSTVAGMAAGHVVFATGRTFLLSRLLSSSPSLLTRGLGARALASGGALLLETPTFWGVSKGLEEYAHPGRQSWDMGTNLTELASLGMSLSILRGVGYPTRSALRWVNRGPSGVILPARGWAKAAQLTLPHASSISGLYLASMATEGFGWSDPQDATHRLFHAAFTHVQFGLTGRAARFLLGRRFAQWNHRVEQQLEAMEAPRFPGGGPRSGVLSNYFSTLRIPFSSRLAAEGVPENILMAASNAKGPVGRSPSQEIHNPSGSRSGSSVAFPSRGNLRINPEESPLRFARRLHDATQEAVRTKDDSAHLEVALGIESLLADPKTQAQGFRVVDELQRISADLKEGDGVLVRPYDLEGLKEPMRFLSLPTTFLPEKWSMYSAENVRSWIRENGGWVERVIEIGTGTGWLSVYLRKLGIVEEVIGVDVTETAPVVSRINAYLNGVDGVRFYNSNLLSEVPQDKKADLIVACISQIPFADGPITQRGRADYTPPFDNELRHHGLGLNFEALLQSRNRLKPGGATLYTLAGRPGLEVLEEMHYRAGLHPRVYNHSIIDQDSSTDISPLAGLEETYGVRFQFLRPGSNDVISAREAMEFSSEPGLRHHQYLIVGRAYQHQVGQILAGENGLPSQARWAYTADPGTEHPGLRESLTRQLSRDWGVRIHEDSVFVGPNYEVLLDGLIRIQTPAGGRVLTLGELPPESQRVVDRLEGNSVTRIASDLSQARDFIRNEQVHTVLLHPDRAHWFHPEALENLLGSAAAQNTRVIVVEPFPFRNGQGRNPIASYLSRKPQVAEKVTLLQPMDQRFGLGSLALSSAVVTDPRLYQYLSRYGELTYSRVSSPVQETYRQFFSGLEHAGNPETSEAMASYPEIKPRRAEASSLALSPLASALSMASSFESGPRGRTLSDRLPVIDMSFGESEFEVRTDMRPAFREVSRFEDPSIIEAKTQRAIANYLQESRDHQVDPQNITLGYGVHPLITSTIRSLTRLHPNRPVQVLVPEGSYGLFYPTASLGGARLRVLRTSRSQGYLVDAQDLITAIPGGRGERSPLPVVPINVPTNPAGQYYDLPRFRQLAEEAKRRGGILLLDDVFGLLNLQEIPWGRSPYLQAAQDILGSNMVYYGGVSKEFASGGLRLGWALTDNVSLRMEMREDVSARPDPLAMAMTGELLARWPETVAEHQNYLFNKMSQLAGFFQERNIRFHRPQGGYALLADLSPLYGRRLHRRGGDGVLITPDNLHHLLFTEAGIRVNAPEWSHTPSQYRFVYSIETLDQAIHRLGHFFRRAR